MFTRLGPFPRVRVTTLANAPLVEVLTEFRWGVIRDRSTDGETFFHHPPEELKSLYDRFSRVAAAMGFSVADTVETDDEPFSPAQSFRRAPNDWPIYQIGIGTLTVNQGNEGYKWATYKRDVLAGVEMVRSALEGIYPEIPFLGAEMAYADAFFLEEDETFDDFLREKLRIKVRVPEQFLDTRYLAPEPWSADFRVRCKLAEPEGTLIINMNSLERMMGRRGVLMTTSVLSIGTQFTSDAGIYTWLESAHAAHQHAFKTMIEPAYRRSFV